MTAPSDLRYLLWSNKHDMWWKPGAWGYTPEWTEAGRFTEAEAVHHVLQSSYAGRVKQATIMVVDVPATDAERAS